MNEDNVSARFEAAKFGLKNDPSFIQQTFYNSQLLALQEDQEESTSGRVKKRYIKGYKPSIFDKGYWSNFFKEAIAPAAFYISLGAVALFGKSLWDNASPSKLSSRDRLMAAQVQKAPEAKLQKPIKPKVIAGLGGVMKVPSADEYFLESLKTDLNQSTSTLISPNTESSVENFFSSRISY